MAKKKRINPLASGILQEASKGDLESKIIGEAYNNEAKEVEPKEVEPKGTIDKETDSKKTKRPINVTIEKDVLDFTLLYCKLNNTSVSKIINTYLKNQFMPRKKKEVAEAVNKLLQ